MWFCMTSGMSGQPKQQESILGRRQSQRHNSSRAGIRAARVATKSWCTSRWAQPCRTSPSQPCVWPRPAASDSQSRSPSRSPPFKNRGPAMTSQVTTQRSSLGLADPSLFRSSSYVDGQWPPRDGGERLVVHNPSTGEPIADLPSAGADETQLAVEAAQRALPAWRGLSGKARSKVLRRWFELVRDHTEDLARLIVLEEGKPLAEAVGEINTAPSSLEWS